MMASSSGASQEQRRWLVVGIALHHVLTPCLRDKVMNEMRSFYQHVVRNFSLDKQTFPTITRTIPPSTTNLNYQSINSNDTLHRKPSHYDYCVRDEVSLAKLYMKPFMAQFNAFDHTFDCSAALSVLCGALPFTSVRKVAEDLKSKVRNEWAHCDFTVWTKAHYDTSFDLMEALVKNLNLSPTVEARTLDELKLWRKEGLEICLGKPLDDTLLQVVRKEVQDLYNSVSDYKAKEEKDVQSTCAILALFKSEFDKTIHVVEQQYSSLQTACKELHKSQDTMRQEMITKDKEHKQLLRTSELHWKTRQEQVENLCKTMEERSAALQRELDLLKTKMGNLALSDDSKEVVFDVPELNKWFTGREKEVSNLEKLFSFEHGGELKMAAICGLGGCGKTTLAAHFAWKHKPEYEGGAYWISMEDDRKFENSLNDLALRLGILEDSFDLTLSKVLTLISKQTRRWLLVLDDVDQQNLSEQMKKLLFGRWKRQAGGHVLLTTRREPKEVFGAIGLEPSRCVGIFVFTMDEAKRFLLSRSDVGDLKGQEMALDELARELGCLPLALEQAGAHIKAVQCSINCYLEEYKIQRLNLLRNYPRTKPSWEYESESRLAVHTTWLLNFEYVRKSPHGELASSFVKAAAFLAPSEIPEELIHSHLLTADAPPGHKFNLDMIKPQIVNILTKFSLFQRKTSKCLGLHRLVQEVLRSRMDSKETASSLLKTVQILHHAFINCPSPDQILSDITARVQEQASASVANPSVFYMWSKLTSHALELQKYLTLFLFEEKIERELKAVVMSAEASRVVYENALHLSVHGHEEKAKEAEQFAFQILDSCASAIEANELKKLFPHTIPLPQMFRKIISYSSRPPTECDNSVSDDGQCVFIDEIRLRGNAAYKDGHFQEAIDRYTEAIEASKEAKCLDPRLLNNRATAHLKLKNFEKCLQDCEEYIKIRSSCWKGYSRKALALNGLGRKGSALCFAAIAYSHDARSCRCYEAFQTTFKTVDERWEIINTSEGLIRSLSQCKIPELRKEVLLLASDQYNIKDAQHVQIDGVTNFFENSDGSNDIVDTTLAAYCNGKNVTINCDALRFSKKCFVQNVSFLQKSTIFVGPNGYVEFTNCGFRSTNGFTAVIVYGTAKLMQCTISDSPGGGIKVQGYQASASLIKCKVNNNGKKPEKSSGIKVTAGGRVDVKECLIHGNAEGVRIFSLACDNLAESPKEATVENSEIYDNKFEGILITGDPQSSCAVDIRRNKIYHNNGHGVKVSFYFNDLRLQKNVVFENLWWGIWVESNSGGYFEGNEIYNNKMGGIRVGKQSPGKPASLVENNEIYSNCGSAFHDGLHPFEVYGFPEDLHVHFLGHKIRRAENALKGIATEFEFSFPNAVSADFKSNNKCIENGKPKVELQAASSKSNCAFCFRREVQLKCCKRCMTARYCGKECQTLHWGRHKYICAAIGQRNTIEVCVPVGGVALLGGVASRDGVARRCFTHPSLEPTGPRHAPRPPKDGARFVVKIQTFEFYDLNPGYPSGLVSEEYNDPNKARMTIYDRSRYLDFQTTQQPQLYHLVMQCGVMGCTMYLGKKMFCWAAYKDNETLRIFTHEFPPLQKW